MKLSFLLLSLFLLPAIGWANKYHGYYIVTGLEYNSGRKITPPECFVMKVGIEKKKQCMRCKIVNIIWEYVKITSGGKIKCLSPAASTMIRVPPHIRPTELAFKDILNAASKLQLGTLSRATLNGGKGKVYLQKVPKSLAALCRKQKCTHPVA